MDQATWPNHFSESFEDYLGFDVSEPMLNLARQKYPAGNFRQGDMRNFSLSKKYDIALITGRSSSYLLSDDDVKNTFASISKVLHGPSLLAFDCIDASKFLPYIKQHPTITHEHHNGNIRYFRKTAWKRTRNIDGKFVDWTSAYFKEEDAEIAPLGNDATTFRVFTISEIRHLLTTSGFKVLGISARKTYAFDTFVVLAKKKIIGQSSGICYS